MEAFTAINEVLHRIKVKLYPNYLTNTGGKYLARTNNEASLSIDQICAGMKSRGGFSGNYENLVENVKLFFDEAAYKLCDGFAINTGYFSIHPNIGGTFNSVTDAHDREKNKIGFSFRIGSKLQRLLKHIVVDIEGLADTNCYIDEFIDWDSEASNSIYIPNDGFVINGHKIKLAGDDPDVGVFFVPVDDPSKAVKATRVFENNQGKIIGIAPKTGHPQVKIEIRTQYAGSGSICLKKPRVITSDFVLEECAGLKEKRHTLAA